MRTGGGVCWREAWIFCSGQAEFSGGKTEQSEPPLQYRALVVLLLSVKFFGLQLWNKGKQHTFSWTHLNIKWSLYLEIIAGKFCAVMTQVWNVYTCTHALMCVRVHTSTHAHTQTHACTHRHAHTLIHNSEERHLCLTLVRLAGITCSGI